MGNLCEICSKKHETEMLKIENAVTKSDMKFVKSDIGDLKLEIKNIKQEVKDGFNRWTWFLITSMTGLIVQLVIIILKTGT